MFHSGRQNAKEIKTKLRTDSKEKLWLRGMGTVGSDGDHGVQPRGFCYSRNTSGILLGHRSRQSGADRHCLRPPKPSLLDLFCLEVLSLLTTPGFFSGSYPLSSSPSYSQTQHPEGKGGSTPNSREWVGL